MYKEHLAYWRVRKYKKRRLGRAQTGKKSPVYPVFETSFESRMPNCPLSIRTKPSKDATRIVGIQPLHPYTKGFAMKRTKLNELGENDSAE